MGLVNRLAEPADLLDAAVELAAEILAGGPLSVKAARDTVMVATEMGRTFALAAAWAAHAEVYDSEDAQEGPLAFSQKRKPLWRGQ